MFSFLSFIAQDREEATMKECVNSLGPVAIEVQQWVNLVTKSNPSVSFREGWSEYGQHNASSLVPRVLVHLYRACAGQAYS